VREISSEEYSKWHCTGKWKDCIMQVDSSKKYYAWDFTNPRNIEEPIKVNKEKRTWIELYI
jgi:hypothetical protein